MQDDNPQYIFKKDEELIQDILKGDGEQYSEIVERFQAGLYRTAYYYTQNTEDARDITQDVLIKVYNNLIKFLGGIYIIVKAKQAPKVIPTVNENNE